MPKRNPKYESRASRYYKRVKSLNRTPKPVNDHSSIYFGLLFVGIIVVVIVIVTFVTKTPQNTNVTVQEGDVVDIQYIGRYADNKTIFDDGTLRDIEVGNNDLLPYFDQQLIGIKLNEKKTFVVPAEYGYTDPSNKLYGHDLQFEVTITRIVRGDQTYE
ncbi:MAG: FKBP-type peptidyl-prolyl cis-trans isomerase [Promethearchaeota archaeon]